MSAAQLYRISRKGAQFTRWEWPNGEPVRGPLFQHEDAANRKGEYRPVSRIVDGVKIFPVKVRYGSNGDVPGVRTHIKLTRDGAVKLAHLGLRSAIEVLADSVIDAERRKEIVRASAPAKEYKDAEDNGDAKLLEAASMFAGRTITDVSEARAELEKNGVNF